MVIVMNIKMEYLDITVLWKKRFPKHDAFKVNELFGRKNV